MKLALYGRSVGAIAFREMVACLLRRRALIIPIGAGVLLLGIAISLPVLPPPRPDGPTPLALWERGPDGSLAAFAYGFVPLVVPVIAIGFAYDAQQMRYSSGFLETAMSRRSPHWIVALGRYLGHTVAVSIPTLAIVGAGLGVIIARSTNPVSWNFVGAILLVTFLIATLYLSVAFIVTTFVSSGVTAWLLTGLWLAFNLVRQTPLSIAGQLLFILPIREAQQFTTGFVDLVSFSGLYSAILAHYTPDSLGFVIRPTIVDLGGTMASSSVAGSGPVVLLALAILYLALAGRFPLGR